MKWYWKGGAEGAQEAAESSKTHKIKGIASRSFEETTEQHKRVADEEIVPARRGITLAS